jgi:hypothetical protein
MELLHLPVSGPGKDEIGHAADWNDLMIKAIARRHQAGDLPKTG